MSERRNKELEVLLKEQKLTNARLENRIRDLEMRVGSDSSNSGKPPSSDSPFDKESRRKKRNKRKSAKNKRGGQKGHKGHHRARLTEVDRVIVHAPSGCSRCSGELVATSDVRRHQQTEFIGRAGVEVIEHQSPLMRCVGCGHRQRQSLPKEIRRAGAFGTRLRALMSVLVGSFRMSRRSVQRFLRDTFDIHISLGAISKSEAVVSDALNSVYEDTHVALQSSAQAHADETPYYQESKLRWLWALVNKYMGFFRIDERRNKEAATKLLGGFKGLLCTDDFGSYNVHDSKRRQLCHAHLARHIQKHIDSAECKRDKKLAKKLRKLHKTMFKIWHLIRDGTIDDNKRRIKMGHIEDAFTATLKKGATSVHVRFANFCKRQIKYTDMLWRFVLYRSEPTNNDAERALRHAVIWRKVSYGTQSERGTRFVERMLTVHHCLRLQKRNILTFVTRVLDATAHNLTLPSLRPGSNIG